MSRKLLVFVPGSAAPPEGPFDQADVEARIRSGALPANVMVCPVGGEQWVPLASLMTREPPPPPPPPPPWQVKEPTPVRTTATGKLSARTRLPSLKKKFLVGALAVSFAAGTVVAWRRHGGSSVSEERVEILEQKVRTEERASDGTLWDTDGKCTKKGLPQYLWFYTGGTYQEKAELAASRDCKPLLRQSSDTATGYFCCPPSDPVISTETDTPAAVTTPCPRNDPSKCLTMGLAALKSPNPSTQKTCLGPLQQACDGQLGTACVKLIDCFDAVSGNTHRFPDKERQRSQVLLEKACASGVGYGCWLASAKYKKDDPEVYEQFDTKARRMLPADCDEGDADACLALAAVALDYETGAMVGVGGPEDRGTALAFYKKSCVGGVKLGCEGVERLGGGVMSPGAGAASAAALPAAPPAPTPHPSSPTAATAAPSTTEQATAFLNGWLQAQNQGDFNEYQKFYALDFIGVKRVGAGYSKEFDRQEWLTDRKNMFKETMTVQASGTTVQEKDPGFVIRFTQRWSAGTYTDEGTKDLTVRRHENDLLIVREELLNSKVISK
jgi:hypothetical protein